MTQASASPVEVEHLVTIVDVGLPGTLKDLGRNGGFLSSSWVSLVVVFFECP